MRKTKKFIKKIVVLSLVACLCMPTGIVKAEEIDETNTETEIGTETETEEQEYQEDTYEVEDSLIEDVEEDEELSVGNVDEEFDDVVSDESEDESEDETEDYDLDDINSIIEEYELFEDCDLINSGKSANVNSAEREKLYNAFQSNNNKLSKISSDFSTTIKFDNNKITNFSFSGKRQGYTMDVDLNGTGVAETELYYVFEFDNSHIILKADVDITTLDENSKPTFNVYYNNIEGLSTDNINLIKETARDGVATPLVAWRKLLGECYNIDITKLGFSSMESIVNNNTSKEHFTFAYVQTGEQNAKDGVLYNPLSAWKKTKYEGYVTKYEIRLEELYIGNEAWKIVKEENPFNKAPNSSQQWILMKFYLRNRGTDDLDSSSVVTHRSFYDLSGNKINYEDFATLSSGKRKRDITLRKGELDYVWVGILVNKNIGMPYLKVGGGWLNTDPNYVYEFKSLGKISTSGIYCAQNYPSIQAGINTKKSDESDTVEYRWVACNNNEPDKWFEVSPWKKDNNWMNWTPDKSGSYVFVCYARVVGNEDASEIQCAFGTEYHKAIKGICQMPYTGEGGGYLIGIESYDNPNHKYQYEMLILDCNLYMQGKDAWVYTTGKCGADGNCLWTVWQPQYGYYWTLFRIYDSSTGELIDEACYGFENVY